MPRAPMVLTLLCAASFQMARPALGRQPRQGVAVLPFSGEGTQELEQAVLRLLLDRLDVRVVLPERWRGEMRRHPRRKEAVEPDDFASGARDLNLRAALCGQVVRMAGKRQLFVDLLDPAGRVLIELTYSLPEAGPIPEETVAALARDLPRAVDRAIGKGPGPATTPWQARQDPAPGALPTQAADSENPFATLPATAPAARPTRAASLAAPHPVFRFATGPVLEAHRLSFSDPQRPGLALASAPALHFAVQLQPIPTGPLSGLFAAATISVSFWQDLHGTDGSRFPRDETRYEGGVGYRVALPRQAAVSLQVGYGSHSLTIGRHLSLPPDQDPVPPDVGYRYVSVTAEGLVPLLRHGSGRCSSRLSLLLSLGFRGLLSAGDIAQPDQYGALQNSAGLNAGAGLIYSGPWAFIGVAGQLTGYFLNFDPAAPAAKRADSANDLYIDGMLLGGFWL